jgi:hypothetical protein
MQEKAITLKNGQVKGIYEYFVNILQQDGKNAVFSYMVYKNAEKLAAAYNEISGKIYNEAADTTFQEFKKKVSELISKYADRDEQGNIKIDEKGQPVIIEQLVEFKEADAKLVEENKEMLDARQARINESLQYLELSNEYSLLTINLTDFPNDAAPGIVGIFAEV